MTTAENYVHNQELSELTEVWYVENMYIDSPSFRKVTCHLLRQIWRSIKLAIVILNLVTGAPCGITGFPNR